MQDYSCSLSSWTSTPVIKGDSLREAVKLIEKAKRKKRKAKRGCKMVASERGKCLSLPSVTVDSFPPESDFNGFLKRFRFYLARNDWPSVAECLKFANPWLKERQRTGSKAFFWRGILVLLENDPRCGPAFAREFLGSITSAELDEDPEEALDRLIARIHNFPPEECSTASATDAEEEESIVAGESECVGDEDVTESAKAAVSRHSDSPSRLTVSRRSPTGSMRSPLTKSSVSPPGSMISHSSQSPSAFSNCSTLSRHSKRSSDSK